MFLVGKETQETKQKKGELMQVPKQRSETEVQTVYRGPVEVSIDAAGCQTVVSTGFRYPIGVNFADGSYDEAGEFIPRYWGWGREDGVIWDYARGATALIRPLNTTTVVRLPTASAFDDPDHQRAEDADTYDVG